jgi:large subunit ribosomal protein L11
MFHVSCSDIMAKPIKTTLKLNLKAGEANPAPPVGTALGPQGINIQQFCLQYNEQTKDKKGEVIPAEITIYEDRTFEFKLKTAPASDLIRRAAQIEKGSAVPHRDKVGKITKAQVKEIAEKKMVDLNAYDLEQASKIVEGTARSMGVTVEN